MYTIESNKVHEVAGLLVRSKRTPMQVWQICISDSWNEGEAHQDWLNSAPAAEIARWVDDIAFDADHH
jgi:hypothetical protein